MLHVDLRLRPLIYTIRTLQLAYHEITIVVGYFYYFGNYRCVIHDQPWFAENADLQSLSHHRIRNVFITVAISNVIYTIIILLLHLLINML